MVDTNIFNHILDGRIMVSQFIGKTKFCITHVQLDELSNTPNEKRRELLDQLMEEFIGDSIPTESFILGTSRLNKAKIGGDPVIPTESSVYGVSKYGRCIYSSTDNLYLPIKDELDKSNKYKPNNVQDALIAETAIKNNLTLLTDDRDLSKVVTRFGGKCINLKKLILEINRSN